MPGTWDRGVEEEFMHLVHLYEIADRGKTGIVKCRMLVCKERTSNIHVLEERVKRKSR